jgi:predicted PurR-regulated permease PerM
MRKNEMPTELLESLNRHLRTIRVATVILAFVGAIATAYFARDFLLPVVLAFLLADA